MAPRSRGGSDPTARRSGASEAGGRVGGKQRWTHRVAEPVRAVLMAHWADPEADAKALAAAIEALAFGVGVERAAPGW